MSTDSESRFIPDTTQGDFWGGYKADFFFYKVLAIFPITGFLGTDHLLLRSPITATMKFLVNALFYGAWYFYDIIQILTDTDFISQYGFSTPWGPRGHGFRYFKDVTSNNANEFAKPSAQWNGALGTIAYIFYGLFCLYLPFLGLPSFVAGDYVGGALKLLSLLLIFTFPYYMVTGFLEYFRSGTIEKEGVPRSWPVQGLARFLLHDDSEYFPAVNLLNKEEAQRQMEIHDASVGKFKEQQTTKTPGVTAWEAAYGYLTGPVRIMSSTANVTEASAEVTKAGAKGADAASNLAEIQAKKEALLLKQMENANAKGETLPQATTTAVPLPKQGGGGFFSIPYNQASQDLDMIVLGGIAVLIVGGFAAAFFRKMMIPKRIEDDERPRKTYGRDDSPPNPGRV
jgi:hypothetical protein